MARPKGSKSNPSAKRNHALKVAATHWTKKYNAATTDEERDFAATKLTKIGISQNSLKKSVVIHEKKKKKNVDPQDYNPANDPEPECLKTCGHISCAPGCPWDAWKARQDNYYDANPELKPKPAPAPMMFVEPEPTFIMEDLDDVPVAARPEPKPAPVRKPAPAPVVRKAREGHSGKFFKEVFYDLPIFERNMILKTLNPAQQAEWEQIETNRAMEAARVMATMPKETSKPVSEIEKQAAFSPQPMVTPPATGQPMTVDQVRETFQNTMGNVDKDSGLSIPIDRRSWMPDLNPLIHK